MWGHPSLAKKWGNGVSKRAAKGGGVLTPAYKRVRAHTHTHTLGVSIATAVSPLPL